MAFQLFGDFIVFFYPFIIDESFEVCVNFIDFKIRVFYVIISWKNPVKVEPESYPCRSSLG